ncbi:D-ribose pyranase [Corynebacterium felinum]|uniref:D-ribose pyranase n=1 Tax=Corynebacterium felinum TaxID=131318 RepID=A0ABU2BBU6_9CORY|nr:D-ribose pyranase [Corynebacterium felinum]MDF5820219.1 D-ribose pyranase [Corynebacterium felinum]MDR7354859.1 D-ribose pyranase [Corynebacterium felinum]WJY94219.1 D-ribose pyranase [Corynebacterium felinum]
MKTGGLLNPDLNFALARLGHTDRFAIADCGLPIPRSVPVIDLSLVLGFPEFERVCVAVLAEVVVEAVTVAVQMPQQLRVVLPDVAVHEVDHEEFKRLISECSFVVRTGSTVPYANAIFHAGVPFS